jgi:drug/metabolite transporter (DMT)-like permease
MPVPTEVMLLVLCGAALHAGWNSLVKAGQDKFLDTVLVAAGAGLVSLLGIPFLPMIAPASWPFAVASGAIHVVYFILVAAAYRAGDMGLAYPIMRGSAPLLVALVSEAVLGERLSPGAWIGVLLICAGVLGLAMPPGGARVAGRGRTIGLALCNAGVIGLYTLVDGSGARASGAPVAYTLWILVLTAVPLLGWAWMRRGAAVLVHARARWPVALVGGVATLGAYGVALWAMTRAPIASVAALRETSILFAMALSATMLRERAGWLRTAAATAVALGAVTLRLA